MVEAIRMMDSRYIDTYRVYMYEHESERSKEWSIEIYKIEDEKTKRYSSPYESKQEALDAFATLFTPVNIEEYLRVRPERIQVIMDARAKERDAQRKEFKKKMRALEREASLYLPSRVR